MCATYYDGCGDSEKDVAVGVATLMEFVTVGIAVMVITMSPILEAESRAIALLNPGSSTYKDGALKSLTSSCDKNVYVVYCVD